MASWGSCDFHELRDLNERIKAAASESEMDAFYTGLLDEMMNGLLTDVKELTPVDRGHLAAQLVHHQGEAQRKALPRGNLQQHRVRAVDRERSPGRRSDGTFRPSASAW